jgi:hypothetical protein
MPSLTSDGRIIDFASLSKTIETAPVEISGNVVELDPIDITSDRFKVLFYYKGDGVFGINASQADKYEMLFSTKTVSDVSFNFISTVFSFYENDIGILKSGWEMDRVISLRKELQKIKSVYHFSGFSTAMSLTEIINAIETDGGRVDGIIVHRFRLIVTLSNASEDVQDIYIIFQFDVPLDL